MAKKAKKTMKKGKKTSVKKAVKSNKVCEFC